MLNVRSSASALRWRFHNACQQPARLSTLRALEPCIISHVVLSKLLLLQGFEEHNRLLQFTADVRFA